MNSVTWKLNSMIAQRWMYRKLHRPIMKPFNFCVIRSQTKIRYLSSSVKEIEKQLITKFTDAKVSEPTESAQCIIAHSLSYQTFGKVSRNQTLTEDKLLQINAMVKDRLCGLPIQYIIGEWDFHDITLKLRPPVFIPRPETEELVDYMCKDITVSTAEHFIEIGTGSGAISVYLLHRFPNLCCTAFEAGKEAYQLTSENAKFLGVSDRLSLHHLRLTNDVDNVMSLVKDSAKVDFIVSNPPYIPSAAMAGLQKELTFEDTNALDGGKDGMDVIRNILLLADRILKPEGTLWLEVDSSHPPIITDLSGDYNLRYLQTIEDFQNIPRFCHLKRLSM